MMTMKSLMRSANLNFMRLFFLASSICLPILAQAQFITNNGINITNSAVVVTNGDWSNSGSTVVINTGTISTTESWTNSGTLSGNGKFILDYATDKNFAPGAATPLTSAVMGTLIKKGTGAALLANKIQINDTLLLSSGLFKPFSTSDTVFINNALVIASPTSFIQLQGASTQSATVAHIGTGDKLFPLGKDDKYLPVKLYKFNASRATANVSAAPSGYTKGPGVDALIDFPYVWKVAEKTASDTSAYVEVSYPDVLTSVDNPIVTREVPGLKYASMGARVIDRTNGMERVKSYSRGLKGAYTIAQGFPGDFVTDSLALVALYNSTNGPGWANKTNWLTGDVETWFGITVTGQSITAVNLAGNQLSGPVPDPLVDILALQDINLSNNAITDLPNFTDNKEIATLNVSGNNLDFKALEVNAALLDPAITFNYVDQADLGVPLDTLVSVGNPFEFNAATEGENNVYQWKRYGVDVTGANEKRYLLDDIGSTNMGEYICEINNTLFPGLTLKTAKQKAIAVANLSGKLFAASETPAVKGTMTLFKINATGKYDTTAVRTVNPDGSYLIEKVVVDDYQLVGFADTLTYVKALPTYYSTNTVYWEEAQTIAVNSNLDDLNIVSAYVPTGAPTGQGLISGIFEEPDLTGGRGEASKRGVSGAGASVRSVQTTARPLDEILTLVAYVFTNELGKFELPNLPKGNYRLNIQYPGYPMDPTSFINITLGDGLNSQVDVGAIVEDNKIKVSKHIITGLWEKEGINVQVYPNPSADQVIVGFEEASSTRSMELLDALSVKITTQAATQKENNLNVSHYPSGMYLLRVKERGEVVKTVRIIVDNNK